MHDLIYENQQILSIELLRELTQILKLSVQGLENALKEGTYVSKVRADFLSGVKSGVNGTPTFFINNVRHNGSFNYAELVSAIKAALK